MFVPTAQDITGPGVRDPRLDQHLDQYEEDFEEEDTVTESWEEAGIDLPGHQPSPRGSYHGPAFPPRAPTLPVQPASDVVTGDLRRSDLLANQAMEW